MENIISFIHREYDKIFNRLNTVKFKDTDKISEIAIRLKKKYIIDL